MYLMIYKTSLVYRDGSRETRGPKSDHSHPCFVGHSVQPRPDSPHLTRSSLRPRGVHMDRYSEIDAVPSSCLTFHCLVPLRNPLSAFPTAYGNPRPTTVFQGLQASDGPPVQCQPHRPPNRLLAVTSSARLFSLSVWS